MGASTLERGTLVNLRGEQHKFNRKVGDTEWQLENLRSGRIVTLSETQIQQEFVDGTLTIPGTVQFDHCGPAMEHLSNDQLIVARNRLAYVRAIADLPNTHRELLEPISQIAQRLKADKAPSTSSVYRWKKLYLSSNSDIRSLVDRTKAKGNRTSRYDKEVLDICRRSIEAKYLTRQRGTTQQALEHARCRVVHENKCRPDPRALKLPSRRLMKRLINEIPAFDRHAARRGYDSARKAFRSVKGHVIVDAALERAEIDHTLLDIVVTDDETGLPLGRPTMTACIDVFTRAILGVYVGFESAGYQTVVSCLKHAFLPKTSFREQYPEVNSDWPAFGVMRELHLDNGAEFHSESLELACGSLGITMVYSPRRQPWYKPMIERFFGTLNRDFCHQLPGTTFSSISEKEDYNPVKEARIPYSDFKKGIMKWIADVYHQEHHRGIDTSPAQRWTSTVRFEDIRFPDDTLNLDAVMTTRHTRKISHKGVEINNLFYNSSDLSQLRQIEADRFKAHVHVDEHNLGAIHVTTPRHPVPLRVPCLTLKYAEGLSLWHHSLIRSRAKYSKLPLDEAGLMKSKKELFGALQIAVARKPKKLSRSYGRMKELEQQSATRTSTAPLHGMLSHSPEESGRDIKADERHPAFSMQATSKHSVSGPKLARTTFQVTYKNDDQHD